MIGLLSWRFLAQFIHDSMQQGYSSQTVLVPFIAAYLVWDKRAKIFAQPKYAAFTGVAMALAGCLLFFTAVVYAGPGAVFTNAAVRLLGVLLMFGGAFVGLFGAAAFRAAGFPFFLLFLMLPLPATWADRIIEYLQAQSTTLSYDLFSLLGVPVYREGFILRLPGVSIEVAKECSGINSSVALLLTALLVAWETLHTTWRRLFLVLLTVPLSIVKNAVRIVILTLGSIYITPAFLTGRLHHEGGFVFFVLALALVYPIWALLHRTEQAKQRGAGKLESSQAHAASSVAGQ